MGAFYFQGISRSFVNAAIGRFTIDRLDLDRTAFISV